MNNDQKKLARRKFVGLLGIFSVAGIAGAGGGVLSKIKPAPKTVRMLTEDGQLVDVDASVLAGKRKKVTDDELKNWIKK